MRLARHAPPRAVAARVEPACRCTGPPAAPARSRSALAFQVLRSRASRALALRSLRSRAWRALARDDGAGRVREKRVIIDGRCREPGVRQRRKVVSPPRCSKDEAGAVILSAA